MVITRGDASVALFRSLYFLRLAAHHTVSHYTVDEGEGGILSNLSTKGIICIIFVSFFRGWKSMVGERRHAGGNTQLYLGVRCVAEAAGLRRR